MYVYTITNNINNKIYVGITKDYETRWRLHRQTCENANHPEYDKVLYKAFRKYGVDNFTFKVVLENLTIEQAKESEVLLIEELDSLSDNQGYNVTKGGDYASGQLKGQDNPHAKLTNAQVTDIVTRRDSGKELQKDIFNDYKELIEFPGFSDIWIGRAWKHLQPASIAKRSHGRAFLTNDQVRTIRTLKGTKSYKALGEEYGVPASTISNIINNKTYKNVT